MKIEYTPIGHIRSPFKEPSGVPVQSRGGRDIEGTVEVLEKYAPGLSDLDGFSHIILLTHFHKIEGYELKVVPFLDEVERGVFSTRSPKRPNPIGIHTVELLGIEGNLIRFKGIDMVDGTPVLDIKPFIPKVDMPDKFRLGWFEEKDGSFMSHFADRRFNRSFDR